MLHFTWAFDILDDLMKFTKIGIHRVLVKPKYTVKLQHLESREYLSNKYKYTCT